MATKISEMTPEEQLQQRAKWRDAQNKTRSNKKAAETPAAQEWCDQFLASPQHDEVRHYAEEQHRQIAQELGFNDQSWPVHPAWYEVDAVVWTLYGFRKNFVRQVTEPSGVVVSGIIFPDVIGSRIVAATHRHGLEKSPAYSGLYRALLGILDVRFGKNLSKDLIEKQAALDVKAELAGTYTPPTEREVQ